MTDQRLTNQLADEQAQWERLLAEMKAEIDQLRGNLSLAEDGLASATQELKRVYDLVTHWSKVAREKEAEIERLREVLTIPNITPETTSSAMFIRTLSEYEKGQPVNTQDLINALAWRVRNQKREIARLHATIGGES